MQNIGILLPRSSYYATIGFDLFQGLKSGLQQLGRDDIRIVSENIGFGADRQQAYRSAEKLLLEENVGIVFAYIGHRTAQLLRPLFMSANRLLIVLDAGAHLAHEWPVSPNVFYHSLHNALGAYLAGGLAVREGLKQGAMVTGYYDGGYLQTFACDKGLTDAGGETVFNVATGYTETDFKLDELVNHVSNHPEACLLPIFSGDFASWFYRDIKKLFPEKLPQIYASPFALEESMLAQSIFPGTGMRGIATWSKHLDNSENKIFIETLLETGREPNLFSLLGWEAATLALEALDNMKAHKNNARLAGEQLKQFSFQSPRGKVVFHAGTQTSLAPLFEVEVKPDDQGHCCLHLTREVSEYAEAYEKMIGHSLENNISGWFNSYTCN
jgi:branched-chain amino acid transport system substrate-binding protein